MANIQKRPDGRWRARYRDNTGKEHAHHFSRKVDAQRWLDETAAAVVTGTYVDPKAGRTTVGQLSPSWLAVKRARVKPKTLAGYQGLMDGLVLPRWGTVPVSAVTGADIESWVAEMTTRGLSASRTRQAYQVLKGVLEHATKGRHLASSPAQGIDLPKMPTSDRRYLSMADLEALADAAGQHALLVRILGYCGLRWGEATALTVAKCDLLRSRLIVDRALSDVNGKMSVGSTKSGKGREVPISRFLRDELASHIASRQPTDLVFPAPRGGYSATPTSAETASTAPP